MSRSGAGGRKKGRGRRAALAVLLLAVLLLAAAADSRYRLELTEYELTLERLPAALDGLRIVHLSDLHGAVFGRENRRLVQLVREQRPDLIALTGDFAGSERELAAVEQLLRGIEGLAPAYYVTGNHEWAGGVAGAVKKLMGDYGVLCLENEFRPLWLRGTRLTVAGVEDPNSWADMISPGELAEQLRRELPEDFVLWLGHRNYWARRYPALPVDLILSGHAHGGIIRLPGLGGVLDVNHHLGAEYEAGLYRTERYCMEVSRGLGNSIPVPRLFNRPELVTLVLHPAGNP